MMTAVGRQVHFIFLMAHSYDMDIERESQYITIYSVHLIIFHLLTVCWLILIIFDVRTARNRRVWKKIFKKKKN